MVAMTRNGGSSSRVTPSTVLNTAPGSLTVSGKTYSFYSLPKAAAKLGDVSRLPFSMKVLLENMLPHLLFGHISDMLYLLGEIRNCEVGTCLDTGHAFTLDAGRSAGDNQLALPFAAGIGYRDPQRRSRLGHRSPI